RASRTEPRFPPHEGEGGRGEAEIGWGSVGRNSESALERGFPTRLRLRRRHPPHEGEGKAYRRPPSSRPAGWFTLAGQGGLWGAPAPASVCCTTSSTLTVRSSPAIVSSRWRGFTAASSTS